MRMEKMLCPRPPTHERAYTLSLLKTRAARVMLSTHLLARVLGPLCGQEGQGHEVVIPG